MIIAGMYASDMPSAASSDGASASAANEPSAGIRANSASDAASAARPATSAARGPMRPTSFSVAAIISTMKPCR